MKHFIALFLGLIFNASAFSSTIKSVELNYDKTQIFKGSTVIFSIKTTNSKAVEYLSTTPKSKYDCDDYKISTNKGLKIDKWTGGFSIEIPKNYALDSIQIDLQFLYNSARHYTFHIPIINYKKAIESIYVPPFQIKGSEIVNLYVVSTLVDGTVIHTARAQEILSADFHYRVISGGRIINDAGDIRVLDTAICNPHLTVSVALKENPSIKTLFTQAISPTLAKECNYSGINGVQPRIPRAGNAGETAKLVIGTVGGNGGLGKNGGQGTHGANGSTLNVYLKLIQSPCSLDSIIEVTINDASGKTLEKLFCDTKRQTIIINSNGGNGGDGAHGSNGGTGGNGRYYIDPENSTVRNGGNGGDGGNGGNGGNSGDGGNINVFYSSSFAPHLWHIKFNTNAGYSGRGGNAGLGGNGGEPGNGDTGKGERGINGRNGHNGQDGRAGRSGTINPVILK
jgi:hypothetical protein